MAYGELIRTARKAIGLSQKQLGAAMRVSEATVSRWENEENKPPWRHVPRLAKQLAIPPEDLFAAIGGISTGHDEGGLYAPLKDLLQEKSLREQRALYDYLVVSSAAAQQPPSHPSR